MILKRMTKKNHKACDVCGGKKSDPFRIVGDHEYVRCVRCKTIYLKTRGLNFQKKRGNTYLEDPNQYLAIVNPHGTRYMAGNFDHAYIEKIGRPKGRLLEIGSGLGHLSYMLFSREWDVMCLELSRAAKDWADEVFKLPSSTSKIEEYKGEKGFDAFVMVEVIEHLYDPLSALKQIRKLATSKALIFGTTPNTRSIHWQKSEQDIYQPHDHIVLFNKDSLFDLLTKAKCKNITITYFGVGNKNDSNLMFSAVIN